MDVQPGSSIARGISSYVLSTSSRSFCVMSILAGYRGICLYFSAYSEEFVISIRRQVFAIKSRTSTPPFWVLVIDITSPSSLPRFAWSCARSRRPQRSRHRQPSAAAACPAHAVRRARCLYLLRSMKNRAIFCRQRRSATSFWFVFSCTSGLIAELALFPLGDRHTPWSCSTPATSKDPRPTGTSLWWLQVAFCISGRQLALLVCLFL